MRSSFVLQPAVCINNTALNNLVEPGFEGASKAEVRKILSYLVHDLLNNIFLKIAKNIFCLCIYTSLHELITFFPMFRVSVADHLRDNQLFICSRPWKERFATCHLLQSPLVVCRRSASLAVHPLRFRD